MEEVLGQHTYTRCPCLDVGAGCPLPEEVMEPGPPSLFVPAATDTTKSQALSGSTDRCCRRQPLAELDCHDALISDNGRNW